MGSPAPRRADIEPSFGGSAKIDHHIRYNCRHECRWRCLVRTMLLIWHKRDADDTACAMILRSAIVAEPLST